jgi:hypothetical protein
MFIKQVLVAASLLSAPVMAQGVNCALLGTFNNHGPFNDIWGYTAPNGYENLLDEHTQTLAPRGGARGRGNKEV